MDIFKGRNKVERAKICLGDNIRVTKSRLTKIPKRVVGIDVYPAIMKEGNIPVTEKNAESTFSEFLGEYKELFKVAPEDLKLLSAKKINKRWYIKYAQNYKGIPVYNATVGLDSSENGKVGSYAANYHPDIKVSIEPKVNLEDVTNIAIKTYKETDYPGLKKKDDILIIYPEKVEDKIIYHLAWKFMIVGKELDPEIEKYFIVDAIDGKIIRSYTARFPGAQITGTVKGEIYSENPADSISIMPIKNVFVDIKDSGRATTNNSGYYKKTVNWSWQFMNWPTGESTFTLEGPYARVQDNGGADYTETRNCNTDDPCNLTWTDADRDHINVFYHMNLFHDWLEDELGYSWVNPEDGTSCFNARVNYAFNNAYAGNPMIFGTNNFARSSDVIYHECTHNILCHIYDGYIGWPNNYTESYAMDEGFADYFACSFTNNSKHGEGCSANPRDLNNNEEYVGKK